MTAWDQSATSAYEEMLTRLLRPLRARDDGDCDRMSAAEFIRP